MKEVSSLKKRLKFVFCIIFLAFAVAFVLKDDFIDTFYK